jgi:hypothetical protein
MVDLSKNRYCLEVDGYEYLIEVMDSTHIRFAILASWMKFQWAVPMHFAQVSESMLKELSVTGAVEPSGRFFNYKQ